MAYHVPNDIDQSEIFLKSKCMDRERLICTRIHSMLADQGYTSNDNSLQRWHKSGNQVIVRFVDDFSILKDNSDSGSWFSPETVVITDNKLNFQPQFRMYQTPDSYFGIYNYIPFTTAWEPNRDLHFSVNRIDSNRVLLLFELIKSQGIDTLLKNNYINFNCVTGENLPTDISRCQANFSQTSNFIYSTSPESGLDLNWIQLLATLMPIRNHKLSIEKANLSSWLTLVPETYSSNEVIAVSEKIFRALTTPAPWMLFASYKTVEFLRSLEFDVLDNVIDHSYDNLISTVPILNQARIKAVCKAAQNQVGELKKQNFDVLQKRVWKAANHNLKVLNKLEQSLGRDMELWYKGLLEIC